MSTVGVLHPGQMGAAVGAEIRRNGHTVLWCSEGRGAATRRRAEDAGLSPVDDLTSLLDSSSVVLSICPPAFAADVAQRVAKAGYAGLFVEANAISPTLAHRILACVRAVGASTVDASIIGPPPGGAVATRLYLAGAPSLVRAVTDLVTGTRIEPVSLGDRAGSASALKMAFASFQKAARVLAAIAHGLADQYDVTDALLAEAERMPAALLSDRGYLPTLASRAWRWAPELREIAHTLDAAGLPGDVADAVAAVLARWAEDRDRADLPAATLKEKSRQEQSRPDQSRPTSQVTTSRGA